MLGAYDVRLNLAAAPARFEPAVGVMVESKKLERGCKYVLYIYVYIYVCTQKTPKRWNMDVG